MPFTLASIEKMKRGHQQVLAETARAIDESLEFGGRHAKDHVNQHPKFTPRTGALQRATKTKVVRTRGGKLLKITNAKPYAASIDRGAKPHRISAKPGKKLRFRGRGGGLVFASAVQHPGNRAYKFLYRAHRSAGRVTERKLSQRLSRVASRF